MIAIYGVGHGAVSRVQNGVRIVGAEMSDGAAP